MKKICICMVAIMMIVSGSAFAEGYFPDLSKYSVEELKTLDDLIQKEIILREGVEFWYDYGFGQYVPKIMLSNGEEPKLGITVGNEENRMYMTVNNVTPGVDFENYVNLLMAHGYDEVVLRETGQAILEDGKGHRIRLLDYTLSKQLSIEGTAYKVK